MSRDDGLAGFLAACAGAAVIVLAFLALLYASMQPGGSAPTCSYLYKVGATPCKTTR